MLRRFLPALVLSLALWAVAADALAGERVALVVGNSAYLNTPPLANPTHDAEDVAKALTAAGFKVFLARDATKRQFDLKVAEFARAARTAEAALFYFAGHGMQFQGANYLMPVDAVLEDEISLRYEMESVDDVKLALQSSPGVKILILDSCRDNPLAARLMRSTSMASRGLSLSRGLAPPQPTQGMVIVYATQSGQTANDGEARNSPFAKAFVEELAEPGVEVAALFRKVERKVFAATGGQQTPELSISGVDEYYVTALPPDRKAWESLREEGSPAALRDFLQRYPQSPFAPQARARLEASQPPAPTAESVEAVFWQSAEKGGALADYQAYLGAYPHGAFAALAANRIAALTIKPEPTPSPAASPSLPAPVATPASKPAAVVKPTPKRRSTAANPDRPAARAATKAASGAETSNAANTAAGSPQSGSQFNHIYSSHGCAPGYVVVRTTVSDPMGWTCAPM